MRLTLRMPDPRPDNEASLTELSRRYRPALLAFFVRRVRNRAEAEDLTQEVFAKLAVGGGRPFRHASAYVFQTAANLLRDRGRREKVRADYRAAAEAEDATPSDTLGPERVVAGRQTLAQVIEALQDLPERTRAIFILHRLEKLKKAEIAAMFGLSVSGIDKHLLKAVIHLHMRLGSEP
jgi:RNA polymerase sigma factor (sigma-70 family)